MGVNLSAVETIVKEAEERRSFSGVAYIARGSEVLLARTCGFANRAEQIPVKVDTRFEIASGSKSLTAIAVMRLIEQGRLALEAPAHTILDFPPDRLLPEVTIGRLLTHSSGIADYADENLPGFDYESLWKDLPVYRIRTLRDWVPLLLRDEPKFAPGARFEYCNSGYILLGLAMEAVTGDDFFTHMQREVLDPAGMSGAGYFEADQMPGNCALGYIPLPDRSGYRTNIFSIPARSGADGGLYASALDLQSFLEAVRTSRLTGEEWTREVMRPQVDIEGQPDRGYGYGFWFSKTPQGAKRMAVIGSDPGTECSCSYYPEHDLTLIVLTNLDDGVQDLRLRMEEVLLG